MCATPQPRRDSNGYLHRTLKENSLFLSSLIFLLCAGSAVYGLISLFRAILLVFKLTRSSLQEFRWQPCICVDVCHLDSVCAGAGDRINWLNKQPDCHMLGQLRYSDNWVWCYSTMGRAHNKLQWFSFYSFSIFVLSKRLIQSYKHLV